MTEKRKSTWSPEARRESTKAFLRAKFSGKLALVMEYIEEAEGQEGPAYWDQFEGEGGTLDKLAELEADFALFCRYYE